MTDTYKVRMLVLTMVGADDPEEAQRTAVEIAADAGLTVLHVEEPNLIVSKSLYGSAEGDIYP